VLLTGNEVGILDMVEAVEECFGRTSAQDFCLVEHSVMKLKIHSTEMICGTLDLDGMFRSILAGN